MSQISMPMRILLIGAVVFLAAWFTILKPGGAEEEIPPVQPANVVEQPAAATPAPADAAEDTPVAATAIPAEVLAKLPKDVAKAVVAGKTLVLGVFAQDATDTRPMADDDRYVRNALKKTNRYDGEVFAKNISLAQLSTYGPLVNELGVTQSPAVVVIDRNLKGTVLSGYVDRIAINQAIADARRNSIDPAITDPYLQQVNAICERFNPRISRWSRPTINGHKARGKARLRLAKIYFEQLGTVRLLRVDAPAKYRSLTIAWEDALYDRFASNGAAGLALKADATKLATEYTASFDEADARKLDRRFDKLGVGACVKNRRS